MRLWERRDKVSDTEIKGTDPSRAAGPAEENRGSACRERKNTVEGSTEQRPPAEGPRYTGQERAGKQVHTHTHKIDTHTCKYRC